MNHREELDDQICLRGLDAKEQRGHDLIKEHLKNELNHEEPP